MRLGRTLWLIILLKLFVLFCIIKPFLFPDILQTRFQSDADGIPDRTGCNDNASGGYRQTTW